MATKNRRKTNQKIRSLIVKALEHSKQLSVNEISNATKLHWITVKRHLIWLKGTGKIELVYNHPRLKVFALSQEHDRARTYAALHEE